MLVFMGVFKIGFMIELMVSVIVENLCDELVGKVLYV